MRYTFDDVKGIIEFNKTKAQSGYTIPMLPRLNKLVGNIDQDQITVVSGLPGSGVSSFIDQNYIMNVLLQWYMVDPDERPPLRILYFSMKSGEMKKLQVLLCNYIKLVHNLVVDIATLNNQSGRLYNLSENQDVIDAIDDAEIFFSEVLDSGVLQIFDGQKKPTDIYNEVTDHMLEFGDISPAGKFEFSDDNQSMLNIVVVDDTSYFLPDSDGFGTVTGGELDEKFKRQLKELKSNYKITAVIAVPSNVGYVRSVKDTEPHYRHLGVYGSITEKGICIYNPINEKNVKFYDGDESLYVSAKGTTLMRTWHIVRNSEGIDSAHDRILFLPGASYMSEHPYKDDITSVKEVLDVLGEESCFHDINN